MILKSCYLVILLPTGKKGNFWKLLVLKLGKTPLFKSCQVVLHLQEEDSAPEGLGVRHVVVQAVLPRAIPALACSGGRRRDLQATSNLGSLILDLNRVIVLELQQHEEDLKQGAEQDHEELILSGDRRQGCLQFKPLLELSPLGPILILYQAYSAVKLID